MSDETVAAIIAADAPAGELVRTVDSILRQSLAPGETFVASAGVASGHILQSLESRAGTETVVDDATARALNRAADRAASEFLVLVPAGYRLEAAVIEDCVATLHADSSIVLAVPAVRAQTPDGRRWIDRAFLDLGPVRLLEDVFTVPPVLCLRRESWQAIGGVEESCGRLAVCDLLLRLCARGRVAPLTNAVVRTDLGRAGWADVWRPIGTDGDELRTLLRRHRGALERVMADLLVGQETGFGLLRERHSELVRSRDRDLQRLDALRADAAHARAYLRHHGRDRLDWGDFRRTDPVSRDWGYDRGSPIDRVYIEEFLAAHSSDIRGFVLEVQENDLTVKFGGTRVGRCAVVDLDDANPRATHLADLRCAPHIPDESFDCIVLTQTLHVIDDMTAVLRECRRLLKPGGVLLATIPSASRVCLEYGERGDFWRTTAAGALALAESVFGGGGATSRAYGSVLTNVAFLEGLASSELTDAEFAATDPFHPVLVGLRAEKPRPARRQVRSGRAVLLYHRVDHAQDAYDLAVEPDQFEEQLCFLARNCHVLPIEELLGTPAADLPPNAVALTFDDGYLDNLERAAPALERAGLPATFFLTSRWLESTGEYWWDTLERVILGTHSLPRSIEIDSGRERLVFTTSTLEERIAAHRRLYEVMVHAGLDERERISRALERLADSPPRRRPLLADEVRQLGRVSGASIGAHSINHLTLPDQPADVVAREIGECRLALERITGRPPEQFAYPYGAVTRRCADVVRSAFRWGCACGEQGTGAAFDAARVPRVEIRNWTAAALSQALDRVFAATAR